jgi:hypothetical protein
MQSIDSGSLSSKIKYFQSALSSNEQKSYKYDPEFTTADWTTGTHKGHIMHKFQKIGKRDGKKLTRIIAWVDPINGDIYNTSGLVGNVNDPLGGLEYITEDGKVAKIRKKKLQEPILLSENEPVITSTGEEFDISSLKDPSIIILTFLDPVTLLALSKTSKKNKKLFNNDLLLNTLRIVFSDTMASISFTNSKIFLLHLALYVECIKVNDQISQGIKLETGDRFTLLTTSENQEFRGTIFNLMDEDKTNYVCYDIHKRTFKLRPIDVFGNIINGEILDGALKIKNKTNKIYFVAYLKSAYHVSGKYGSLIDRGISIYGGGPDNMLCYMNDKPHLFVPYYNTHFSQGGTHNKEIKFTGYSINDGPNDLKIYQYDDLYIFNKSMTKIKNLQDGTELWEKAHLTGSEMDITGKRINVYHKNDHIITLGDYAYLTISIYSNNIDEVNKYLTSYPESNISYGNNQNIIVACQKGHIEMVQILLSNHSINPAVPNNASLLSAANGKHFSVIKILLKDIRVDMSLTKDILENEIIRTIFDKNVSSALKALSVLYKNNIEYLLNTDNFYVRFLKHIIRTRESLIDRINALTYIVSKKEYEKSNATIFHATNSILKFHEPIPNYIKNNLFYCIRGFLLLSIYNYKEIMNILQQEDASLESIKMFLYLCAAHYGYDDSINQGIMQPSDNFYDFNKSDVLKILVK